MTLGCPPPKALCEKLVRGWDINADIKTQRLLFFLWVVPNPFSPGALVFWVQIFVTGHVTCRGRCSTGSLPVVRDMEEDFLYVGLHISAHELAPWLKHAQARRSCQLSPCHAIRDAGAICGHSEQMRVGSPCWEIMAGGALLEVALDTGLLCVCVRFLFTWRVFYEVLGFFPMSMYKLKLWQK